MLVYGVMNTNLRMDHFCFSQMFKTINQVIFVLIGSIGCIWVAWFIGFFMHEKSESSDILFKPKPVEENAIDFEKMIEGPFSLQEENEAFPLPGLRDEFVYLGPSERPDSKDALILGVQSSKKQVIIDEMHKIYLDYDREGLKFSKTETPLSVVASRNGNELRLVTSLNLPEMQVSAAWDYKKAVWSHPLKDQELLQAVSCLRQSIIWTPDQLIQLYGGVSYNDKKNKMRIKLSDKMHFISLGDFFVWADNQWKIPEGDTKNQCLSRVVKTTSDCVKFNVWSPQGLDKQVVAFHVSKEGSLNVKIDEMFTRIRKRTKRSVSCFIDQKSRLLRQGDWLERRKSGWKTLASIEELDTCLRGESEGELLVFDGVEKLGDKWVFLGHLFDSKHINVQQIQLPLYSKPKAAKKSFDMHDFDDDDDLFDDDDDFLNSLIPDGGFDD